MRRYPKFIQIFVISVCFLLQGMWLNISQAGFITTDQLTQPQASAELSLQRQHVRQQLSDRGVSNDFLDTRIAALSDAEIQLLADRIDELHAGAGALEVIGIVFLVLLLLELVGVTDVFKRL